MSGNGIAAYTGSTRAEAVTYLFKLPLYIPQKWLRITVTVLWWALLGSIVAGVYVLKYFLIASYWIYAGWIVRLAFQRRRYYRRRRR